MLTALYLCEQQSVICSPHIAKPNLFRVLVIHQLIMHCYLLLTKWLDFLQEVVEFLMEFKALDLLSGVIDKSRAPRATVRYFFQFKIVILCLQRVSIVSLLDSMLSFDNDDERCIENSALQT
jgi:hypothetical protein